MTKFIKLFTVNDEVIVINIDFIEYMQPRNEHLTAISVSGKLAVTVRHSINFILEFMHKNSSDITIM